MSQNFLTTDVLRLEIEDDPTGLVNLIQNPSGELGGWGWLTPVDNTRIFAQSAALWFQTTVAQAAYFTSEPVPVLAGQYLGARLYFGARSSTAVTIRARYVWLDSNKAQISLAAQTAAHPSGVLNVQPALAPAGTAYALLRIDVYVNGGNPTANTYAAVSEVTVAKAATAAALGSVRTNYVLNPTIEVNAAGYTGLSATTASRASGGAVGANALRTTQTLSDYPLKLLVTGIGAVTPGNRYAVQFRARSSAYAINLTVTAIWKNSSGGVVSRHTLRFGENVGTATWTTISATPQAPNGATALELEIDSLQSPDLPSGFTVDFDAFMVEQSDTVGTYFDGSTAAAGGFTHTWEGTAHNSRSTASSSQLSFIEPIPFIDILGPTHDIKVTREALNVGTLTATVLDAALDPSTDNLIRPGRRVRLRVLRDGVWTPIFTGKAQHASVTYDYKNPDLLEQKRARIELTALDNLASLGNQKRSEGVATIADLPYVLEGCGVPWNVNGSGDQVPTATVVAINDNASAVDQVAITRDSVLGYAWVDRFGVVQAWDKGQTFGQPVGSTIGTSLYSDIDIDYDTDRCINEVTIKFLRLNPSTGETEEVAYGPYRDETSIGEWGVHSAEFTVQGLSEETADLQAYANAILTANATPVRRVNSLLMPLRTATAVKDWGVIDLYSNPVVEQPATTTLTQRVTLIEHTITPDKWLMRLGFETDGSVAAPQFTPSPQTGAGGKTIGQLLRPVGEITMYGSATAPAGWLSCNGASVAVSAYPDLFDVIGYTFGGSGASFNLPNFTDRFPIGSGTKAVGTSGGASTKTIAEANLPPHTHGAGSLSTSTNGDHQHGVRRSNGTGNNNLNVAQGNATSVENPTTVSAGDHSHSVTGSTSSTGNGLALDVLNPWRAVNFIIRAV